MNKPLVFISYASDEVELADFLKHILLRISANKIEIFVAKRDIASGDNPLKIMLEEKLKSADAIIPICSHKAKNTSWVWWETASVWAKTGRLYPLFTNISAGDFGQPLNLVAQGKDYFIKDELLETVRIVCARLEISPNKTDFTTDEGQEYIKLEKKYLENIESAHVKVGYDILDQSHELHKYSFKFEIQNNTQSVFNDIVLELFFPEKYLDRKEWKYPHLNSSIPDDMPGYLCLTFEFNNIPETGKRKFSTNLLPGKTLPIFGRDGMNILKYSMDSDRYKDISKFEVKWTLYINKGVPQKGRVQFETLQFF